ncbi:MAG: right-handed parallel beta-helix repeat-containing protein [Verrucomicrobia subdivision 3 bacterium]|nr:right-handed parallel beta-helix repeat-containing protein [Limisphaerales bacterium]
MKSISKVSNAGTLTAAAGSVLAVCLFFTPAAFGAPLIVTTTADSGSGSLRNAIDDSNLAPGPDEIVFAIPGTGPQTISLKTPLPEITDSVVIDGYTQAGAGNSVKLIHLDGTNIVFGDGLQFAVGVAVCVVRGLVIEGFPGNGISLQAENFGITLDSNTIRANGRSGVYIIAGDGNSITGNMIWENAQGIFLGGQSRRTLITRNFIGRDEGGNARPNTIGVEVECSGGEFEGTGNVIDTNVIWSNTGTGVIVRRIGSSRNVIRSNYIANNGADGVLVFDGALATIVTNNAILFNTANGVRVAGAETKGVLIRHNYIGGNAKLGIDLGGLCESQSCQDDANTGVTLNDSLDADTGPNDLQNFPELTSAITTACKTSVSGRLRSSPQADFDIEFFVNDASNATTNAQGKTYLGSIRVTTDSNGIASFAPELPAVAAGSFITATATGSGNALAGTSEFSAGVEAVAASALVMQMTRLSGNLLSISWSPTNPCQRLQSASQLTGPWQDVDGSTNPYVSRSDDPNQVMKFFRVVEFMVIP